jgi:hypothetical protein
MFSQPKIYSAVIYFTDQPYAEEAISGATNST